MPPKKSRAVATPGSPAATQRYHLYRMAYGRISEAMDAGFYLEAITLIESIATDRLESRLSFLTGTNRGFENLGPLITSMRKHEQDPALRALVDKDLDAWREMRNASLHEMPKLAAGDSSTWEDRTLFLSIVAIEGLDILRQLSKQIRTLKKAGK